ncbi:helix-turn-helix domain-containing protein, partial [Mycobacterium sp. NAZ190054]|uniref:helix-turn-helix domain-containing protein n=1 Tax=Mycobacterium sp. NAZ190054 TaxID=1747766 RepID=UPI000A8569C4
DQPLGDCWRHDAVTGPGLTAGWLPLHKLSQWLTYSLLEPGDPARTAAALGVHENTVRYRMRRMAELTELRLDDADKRFAMMIELAVLD